MDQGTSTLGELSIFPLETIGVIVDHVQDQRDLGSLCLVNQQLYSLASQPRRWRRDRKEVHHFLRLTNPFSYFVLEVPGLIQEVLNRWRENKAMPKQLTDLDSMSFLLSFLTTFQLCGGFFPNVEGLVPPSPRPLPLASLDSLRRSSCCRCCIFRARLTSPPLGGWY
jgi:hypothetical protein